MALLILLFIILMSVMLNGEQRIMGGDLAKPKQFPYQVSIQYVREKSPMHTCGGSLIDLNNVLTAAHCVDLHIPPEFLIWAGSVNLRDAGETRGINSIIVHDKWSWIQKDNDIAIVVVEYPFEKSEYIKPIPLRRTRIHENAECIVSGWGIDKHKGNPQTELRFADLVIVNHEQCTETYMNLVNVTNKMICANKDGKDSCKGDSGGPLTYNNELVGVVSLGYGCEIPDYPGVYTDVSSYIHWIQKNTLNSYSITQGITNIAMYITSTLFSIFFG